MNILQMVGKLFEDHAPETLMAFFGASTSIVLFFLIWSMLRHMFGLQRHAAAMDEDQEQTIATLIDALVSALVTEAQHLRETVDGALREAVQIEQQHTRALADLTSRAEAMPGEVKSLLRPEFEYLQHELRQVEIRIIEKLSDMSAPEPDAVYDEDADAS